MKSSSKKSEKPKPLFESVPLPKLEVGEEYLIYVDTNETGPNRILRTVATWCYTGQFQERTREGERKEPPVFALPDVKRIYRLPELP